MECYISIQGGSLYTQTLTTFLIPHRFLLHCKHSTILFLLMNWVKFFWKISLEANISPYSLVSMTTNEMLHLNLDTQIDNHSVPHLILLNCRHPTKLLCFPLFGGCNQVFLKMLSKLRLNFMEMPRFIWEQI